MLHRYKSQLHKTTNDLSKISSETSLNYTLMFQKTKTYGFIGIPNSERDMTSTNCPVMTIYGKEEL